MEGLSPQDQRDIEELERQARRPRGTGGGGDLDGVVSIDCSEAGRIGVVWPEGKHPFEVTKVERKASQPRYNEKTQSMNEGGVPYVELELTCIGGDMRGETISDRLMMAGKGLSRFVIFTDAIGMYDKERKAFNGRLIDFMGQQVWGAVVTEKSEYQGRSRERSIIDFAGYEPISTYPVPGMAMLDGFENEEASGETYTEEEVEAADFHDEVLETIPAPAPPPTPAPRRASAAAAGAPGGKPPWSKS